MVTPCQPITLSTCKVGAAALEHSTLMVSSDTTAASRRMRPAHERVVRPVQACAIEASCSCVTGQSSKFNTRSDGVQCSAMALIVLAAALERPTSSSSSCVPRAATTPAMPSSEMRLHTLRRRERRRLMTGSATCLRAAGRGAAAETPMPPAPAPAPAPAPVPAPAAPGLVPPLAPALPRRWVDTTSRPRAANPSVVIRRQPDRSSSSSVSPSELAMRTSVASVRRRSPPKRSDLSGGGLDSSA